MHLLVIEDERVLCETIVRSLRRLASVSYTHLDVYKRQGRHRQSDPLRMGRQPALRCSGLVRRYYVNL